MPLVKDRFKRHLTNRCFKNMLRDGLRLPADKRSTHEKYHKQHCSQIILDKNYTCNIQKYHKEINSG